MTEKIIQVKSTTELPNLMFTPDIRDTAINDITILADTSEVNGPTLASGPAQGTITMSGIATVNQTFVIDTQTFIWKASRSGVGEVTIGANKEEAAANIVDAVTLDLTTVYAEATYPADGTLTVTAIEWGVVGNTIDFTESSTNMVMDDYGGGHLGGTIAGAGGWEELEHINITGAGYVTRLTASDLFTPDDDVGSEDVVMLMYRIKLYDDTDDVVVNSLEIVAYVHAKIISSGYLTYISTMQAPFIWTEIYQTLTDGHDYIWSLSWLKLEQGATLTATSLNRNLTVQEIKR